MNYTIYEGEISLYDYLKTPKVRVGDTIEYVTNNQEGWEKYKVILDGNIKSLIKIDDYDNKMFGIKK